MEILCLDQFSVMGGAQLCLLDILEAVEKHGWHARVALPGKGPLADRIRARGSVVFEIPCGPYRSGSKSVADLVQLPFDIWRQTQILAGLLRSGTIDLVYVNGPRL